MLEKQVGERLSVALGPRFGKLPHEILRDVFRVGILGDFTAYVGSGGKLVLIFELVHIVGSHSIWPDWERRTPL